MKIPQFSNEQRNGFTLVEMLVVIAIISLLVALLLPVFFTSKEKARQAICLNNLHQFGVAYHLYANNFNGWFPPGGARAGEKDSWIYSTHVNYDGVYSSNILSGGSTKEQIRKGLLWEYIGEYEVYKCPGDKNKDIRNFSYSQNVAYQLKNIGQCSAHLPTVSLMVEEQRPDDGAFWYQNSGSPDSRDCLSFDRHNKCTNLLFGDGHVKALPYVNAAETGSLQSFCAFPGEENRW